MKGFGAAASGAFQQQQQQPTQPPETPRAGELHKDPVCGTYVPESTSFRRQLSGKTVYYCSDACRQKHAA
jgi:YHS domain-containing protein